MTDAPAPVLVTDRVYTGAKSIARRIGCSARTVLRLAKSRELRTFKTGPRNSPIRCQRSEIDRLIAEWKARG